jgi:hypothetical protein
LILGASNLEELQSSCTVFKFRILNIKRITCCDQQKKCDIRTCGWQKKCLRMWQAKAMSHYKLLGKLISMLYNTQFNPFNLL